MTEHVRREDFLSYWSDDLDLAASEALEDHVMACAECAKASERVAAVAVLLRSAIPPLLTQRDLGALAKAGARVSTTVFHPGADTEARFSKSTDLMVLELVVPGVAEEDTLELVLANGRGEPQVRFEDAVHEGGTVRIACQRHFEQMFPDPMMRVTVRRQGAELAQFAILHIFE